MKFKVLRITDIHINYKDNQKMVILNLCVKKMNSEVVQISSK